MPQDTSRPRPLSPLVGRRALCALAALTAGVSVGPAWLTSAQATPTRVSTLPAGLKVLLGKFRKVPGLSADFEEEKNIVLLAAPLRSTGTVYFHPPHSLARLVEKPQASHLVITGTRIVIKDKEGRKEVDLSHKPALRGLISSLLHVLSGNEKALLNDYSSNFMEQGTASWRLELVPKNPDVRRMVQSFTLSGKGLKLDELRVKEASGDETITRFSNVNEKRRFTKSEISRFFEI